ncbi:MAG: hypothetical protein V4443_11390 [Pseudomonadota bacterium]
MEIQQSNQSHGKRNRPPMRDHSGDHDDHQARQQDHSQIQGWGADLDHANRPAYPMERTPPRLDGVHWQSPEDQPLKMKIYHSTERPGITPVFGTSSPPRGLSGKIREYAYKLSENDIRHWLLLLLADRINVVEGIGQDLSRGHVPNIFAEMGGRAEFRYNPAGFARKAAVAAAVVGISYYLIKRRSSR